MKFTAALKFGALLENVVIDDDKVPDYDDSSLTENTRAAYPLEYIPNAELSGIGGHPKYYNIFNSRCFWSYSTNFQAF